jgi:hypothetical protein
MMPSRKFCRREIFWFLLQGLVSRPATKKTHNHRRVRENNQKHSQVSQQPLWTYKNTKLVRPIMHSKRGSSEEEPSWEDDAIVECQKYHVCHVLREKKQSGEQSLLANT